LINLFAFGYAVNVLIYTSSLWAKEFALSKAVDR